MARGRILDKEVCDSDSFSKLDDSNSQLLCVLLTSWWDDHGKMIGDNLWIKGNIVRKLKQFTLEEISRCLRNISDNLDVEWWVDEKSNKWLYWKKFDKYQTISKDKKSKDKYPSPKFPKTPQESSVISQVKSREVNISQGINLDCKADLYKILKETPLKTTNGLITLFCSGLRSRSRCYDPARCQKWLKEIVNKAVEHKPENLYGYLKTSIDNFHKGEGWKEKN